MAQLEPMDIDAIESDFDNKENAFHHNNVSSRTPCTEKGYEELDVSELNMKLRYSMTPASSPMTKSLTGPCLDNRNNSSEDYLNNAVGAEIGNLTRSLNSSLNKTEGLNKSKVLPLQTLSADLFVDSNRNSSIRRLLDPADNNGAIISSINDNDDNLSVPSTCSSVPDTPEATTPTKEIPKPEGSPIMRGLKSVLSMFRPSQSPVPPADDKSTKQETVNPFESVVPTLSVTPAVKQSDGCSSKRSSPLKESLVFNDDLERELQWKDQTTIILKEERVPLHKLHSNNLVTENSPVAEPVNTTVEYMDISGNESILADNTMSNIMHRVQSVKNDFVVAVESDNEFLDCETTFSKDESDGTDCKKFVIGNEIIVTRDEMVDLTVNAEISQGIESENKNVLNNTGCELDDITVCPEQASMSVTDATTKTDRNDTNIIVETHNLLNSERQYYGMMTDIHTAPFESQNTGLQNKSQGNKKLQLLDTNITHIITVSPDKESLKNYLLKQDSSETKSSLTLIMENDIITYENVEDMGNNTISSNVIPSQTVCTNIDNLSDICTKVLNSIENIKESSEISHATETKENIYTVDNMAVTVAGMNFVNYSTFDSRAKNTEFIDSVPNTEEPSKTHHLVGTQFVKLELDKDLLNSNKDITVDTDKNSSMVIESLNESHSSNNVKSNLNEDYKIIEDLMPVTKLTKDMPLKKIAQSDLAAELNVVNIDIESGLHEINIIEKFNHGNFEVIETNDESISPQISLKDNVGFKNYDDTETPKPSNTFSVLNIVSSKIPELPVKNDVVVINSPSEIPLPDEYDFEQNILPCNVMYKTDCDMQNTMPTTFKNCEESSVVSVGNELLTVCAEYDNPSTRPNSSEENKGTFKIDEDRFKLTSNMLLAEEDLKVTQTCPNQSANAHMIDDKECNENITRDNVISDLQLTFYNSLPKENASENISMQEGIYKDVEQNVPETHSKNICLGDDKSIVNKFNVEKIPSNTEETFSITEVELGISVKPGNINDVEISEETNQLKIVDKQQSLTPEKEVGDVDEEIITSANNSPYVSVTDLAIDVEQKLTDPLEGIDNPFATNAKLTSPAISPKIISKGYNFNFEEIDDPFATKIKIRKSPTPDACNESFATFTKEIPEVPKKVNNRRKSQLEKKRPIQKKNMNMANTGKSTNKGSTSVQRIDSVISTSKNILLDNISTTSVKDNMSENKPVNFITTVSQKDKYQKVDDASEFVATGASQVNPFVKKEETQNNGEEMKSLEKTLVISTEKNSSSSEQYFSLGTSSGESSCLMNPSKNVFNLPEIDDMNFNPFSTKSKMRLSPPPADRTISLQCTGDVTNSSFDAQQPSDLNNITTIKDADLNFNKITTQHSSHNTSNATCSSKNTNDEGGTTREILTEDEDTIEGPFLETEDFTDTEKLTDVEVDTGMINFDVADKQDKDENLENGELFIDADAFEFLLNQNKSTTVLDSGKESLFLKFDPLFAKRVSSDGILAALNKVQKRQSTPKKVTPMQKDLASIENPVAGSSYDNENSGPIEEYNEDLSSTVTKPMMVVNPAISSIFTQKKSATPKLNRRSLTFTSPAMAVIDRLLSLNGNSSHLDYDPSIPQVGRERTETDLAITQLRELLAEKNIDVHHLRSESKELKARLAALEVQVSGLENESAERLAKINKLNERLSEKTKLNKCMATVVEEYERTIATLIAETEQNKKRNAEERMRLIKERDEQTTHLTNMEVSFNDLHSKYEKSKQILLKCKAKEEVCRKSIQEFQENLTKMQNNYELLKQHATSKLNHANQELEKMNRAHEAEVLKMNALMKRKELHITSLEESLAQKTKANEELTAICDELINKVG